MALYFSFSCWYMRLYFSTGSRDKVLLNSLLLHSEAQRTSLGSRSADSQGSFGYATPSENHASGVSACSSNVLQIQARSAAHSSPGLRSLNWFVVILMAISSGICATKAQNSQDRRFNMSPASLPDPKGLSEIFRG